MKILQNVPRLSLVKIDVIILLLRLVGSVVFGSLGNFLGRSTVPPNAPIPVPEWTGVATTIIFATFGFFSPEIFSFLAKAGIIKLAQELPKHLPPAIPKNPIKLRLAKKKSEFANFVILDTSAIVDGRVFEIVKTGFLVGQLIILPQVLAELQNLADSGDDLKRARGRAGLDLLHQLKKEKIIPVKFGDFKFKGNKVDEQLLGIAKKLNARLLTCDFNLEKVAKLQNIRVLNVNSLSQAVRMKVLPGEELKIELIHLGKTKNQGVGYLPDGTMVVVENGGKFIGSQVRVKVHRSLQTLAGRMIFGKTA